MKWKPTDKGALKYALSRFLRKMRPSGVLKSNIHPTAAIESNCQIVDTEIGAHSYCGHDCIILNARIGAFCSIADQVCIGAASHPLQYVSTSPVFLSHRDSVKTKFAKHQFSHYEKITIGCDVWIGFGARILPGLTIGHGAVIGMGAMVTKSVDPYMIVAGNPARVVSRRFSPELTDALLASRWWEMSEEELRAAGPLFNDPPAFLKSRGLL